MAIKRKVEENSDEAAKKAKKNETFPIENFLKNLKDPETSFLALAEFNENIRRLSTQEEVFLFVESFGESLKSNLNDVLILISEEKRKASENITLYRFLTTLMEYFLEKNESNPSETIVKKFLSIPNSLYTIYFMLSSNSTASHAKITLRFLFSLVQCNEFTSRMLFSSIDLKKPCWKSLLRRRDIRDPEDVRFWTIKFIFSSFVYRHLETTQNLMKEQEVFREIFQGLVNDKRQTVEFVLEELKNNILMFHGVTKTEKLHLFDDRNLRSLIRLYKWTGEQKQRDKKKNSKNGENQENMEIDENEENDDDREKIRRLVHQFLMILLNSKIYGINFFDPTFGSSNKNANPIILKVIQQVCNSILTLDYATNLIGSCLSTSPDLLQPFFKMIANDFLGSKPKNVSSIFDFLCEVVLLQKPLENWKEIFDRTVESTKLADFLINLTIPIDLMSKFEQIVAKNADFSVQFGSMRFLSLILSRIEQSMKILQSPSLICDRNSATEIFQQAILRFVPKPDHFCDAFAFLKSIDNKENDFEQILLEYLDLLSLYSKSCLSSTCAINFNLDNLFSNSMLHLLNYFKDFREEKHSKAVENYFSCLKTIVEQRESTDDAVWARQNKDLASTPIRTLIRLARILTSIDEAAEIISSIIVKFSSMLSQNQEELKIWFYTLFNVDENPTVEQFLSQTIEKIILNPYPLFEKSLKNHEFSLLIYSALDSVQHKKEPIENDIDEFLCDVIFSMFLGCKNPTSDEIYRHLAKVYLTEREQTKIFHLLDSFSTKNSVFDKQRERFERTVLSKIDQQRGPNRIQMEMAMKLNTFKIFYSEAPEEKRLVTEMIQCLRICGLLDDPKRSMIEILDKTLFLLEERRETIKDEAKRRNLIVELICGLEKFSSRDETLKSSKIVFQCFQHGVENENFLRFVFRYVSSDFREILFESIYRKKLFGRSSMDFLVENVGRVRQFDAARLFDFFIENFQFVEDFSSENFSKIFDLIEKMKTSDDKSWKTTIRNRYKSIVKLIETNLDEKFFVLTLKVLRTTERQDAVRRLIDKSKRSPLRVASIFHQFFLDAKKSLEQNEIFLEFFNFLIENFADRQIVFDLVDIFQGQNETLRPQIDEILKNSAEEKTSPRDKIERIFFLVKLFPEENDFTLRIYRSLLENLKNILDDPSSDDWIPKLTEMTKILLEKEKDSIDLKKFINDLLKSEKKLSSVKLELLKVVLESFVSNEEFDRNLLGKFFGQFLKNKNFVEEFSSENRILLVDLLSVFVRHYDSSRSKIQIDCEKHFSLLLSIYNPTLSIENQKILSCMHQYEKSGYSMVSTFLWSDAALNNFNEKNGTKTNLFDVSKVEQVFNLLDDRMMAKSILHFPVKRRMRSIEPTAFEHGDQIYDPVFLIPVFYHCLGSENYVKCQRFVEKHCLSYCLMALSSRCGLLRAVVYNCLFRFEQHLFSQKFYCKEQISTFLTLFKRSLKKANLKLAPIVALFLSKLVDLLTHPESKIYRRITRFLLRQSVIDLIHVPLFAELFHSSNVDYKFERNWILNLLKNGIKDPVDYSLCNKSLVFKILMTFYDCSLCDEPNKLEILQVFQTTTSIQETLPNLLFDYGFLLWLQIVVKNCSPEGFSVVVKILENVVKRLSTIENQLQLVQFESLLIVLLDRRKSELFSTSNREKLRFVLKNFQLCLKALENRWISSLDFSEIDRFLQVK